MTPSERQVDPWPPAPPPAPGEAARPPSTSLAVPLDQPSRTSPLTVALELAGLATLGLGMALAALAGAGLFEELLQVWAGVIVILVRLVGWWFRTYTVTSGELLLDEGVLQRRHRVLPLSRIQQVELRQQLVARLFGITTVHIETAGDSGRTAVTLRSLDLRQAEALRDHLLAEQRRVRAGQPARPSAAGPGAAGPGATGLALPPRVSLVRLRTDQLLFAGATSTATVAVAALWIVGGTAAAAHVASELEVGAAIAAGLALLFVLAGAGTLALFGAAGAVLQAWGYDLSTAGDDLHVEQGLIDRRQHTMPRHRLQHARVLDNPVRHALRTKSLQLRSAATPGRGDEQQAFIDVPLVRSAEAGNVLVAAMGTELFRPPPLAPRPPAARGRALRRRTTVTVVLAVTIAGIWWPTGIVALPLALLGVPWGVIAHRRAGFALDGPVLAVASGAIVHRLELVPTARLQSVRTTTNPLQRRVGLASVHLDVAGTRSAPGLADLSADVTTTAQQRLVHPS